MQKNQQLQFAGSMVGVAAVTAALITGQCNKVKPAPDHHQPVVTAPVARPTECPRPNNHDMKVDRRFGEESITSDNFDLDASGFCGDGAVQTASTTRNVLSQAIVRGRITGSTPADLSKEADTQVTSYGSGRTETSDGANHTQACPIDTALRGNGVCDSNVGSHEQRPTFIYSGFARINDAIVQVASSECAMASGTLQCHTMIQIDESVRFLNQNGTPAVGATTIPDGGSENPWYAPQDCRPSTHHSSGGSAPSGDSCSDVLDANQISRIRSNLIGPLANQRQAWVQRASGTYVATFVLNSTGGNMRASNGRCSGPSDCTLDLGPVNTALQTVTGPDSVRCVFRMAN